MALPGHDDRIVEHVSTVENVFGSVSMKQALSAEVWSIVQMGITRRGVISRWITLLRCLMLNS